MDDDNNILGALCTMSNNLEGLFRKIDNAAETNTCPYCNQQIIPGADKCDPNDVINHVATTHGDMQG